MYAVTSRLHIDSVTQLDGLALGQWVGALAAMKRETPTLPQG